MSEHDDTTQDDVLFWSRFQHITETSFAGLSPDQLKQGLAEIERTGRPGVHVQEADDSGERVALIWGGIVLAKVHRRVFSDEAYFQGLDFTTASRGVDASTLRPKQGGDVPQDEAGDES